MNSRLLIVVWLMLPLFTPAAFARKWTDSTGTFSIEAELLDFQDGKVRLKKPNGNVITVAVDRLSQADQQFVRQHY